MIYHAFLYYLHSWLTSHNMRLFLKDVLFLCLFLVIDCFCFEATTFWAHAEVFISKRRCGFEWHFFCVVKHTGRHRFTAVWCYSGHFLCKFILSCVFCIFEVSVVVVSIQQIVWQVPAVNFLHEIFGELAKVFSLGVCFGGRSRWTHVHMMEVFVVFIFNGWWKRL